ncbi:hypothetical protein [Chryseobacterium sp. G0201]|uniref:hypothetical protein n=1 Tax=Chryseobacterium sp. G0201 TaxID=2487065 RepID=UPI000F4D463A|nr:hypothetical protein [Chryseobacterium sp. G0201]AZA51770.1 hypothetical protein EG348_01450 [Chryseobacterium sp. G0201]
MKKTFLFAAACFLFLTSCNNESIPTMAQENQTAEAVQNFKRAVITFNNNKDLPMFEERRNKKAPFPEMSEQRKDILVPAAKHLIKSTGIKDEQIEKVTNGDKAKIIAWAMEVFQNNYSNSSL